MRKRTSALLVVGVLVLGGCSSNSSPGASGTQSTRVSASVTHGSALPSAVGSSAAGTGVSAVPVGPVALGDADKGKAVSVAVGQTVTVTLTGADWRFVDPKPATVLTPSSPPVVANGTTSISFRGAKPGTATATASRGNETFTITVIVQ